MARGEARVGSKTATSGIRGSGVPQNVPYQAPPNALNWAFLILERVLPCGLILGVSY